MIQVLLVTATVRIGLVYRGLEIAARAGSRLVRISRLPRGNGVTRSDVLTHAVVARGSSGGAASGTVARSTTMRAARGSSGDSRRTGCASTVGASCGCTGGGSAIRTCAGRGCAGGRSASRGGTSGASSVGAGGRSASRGSAMRTCAGRGCAGGRSARRGSAVCARAGRRSPGCAVGGASRTVGGATGIRIHKRVVVSAVRRAGCSVRGSRVAAGASIASCGRMRRRGGLSHTRHTVGAVARIRGRKSRILDIRTTVRGMAGVTTAGCLRCGRGLGCAGGSVLLVSRRGVLRSRVGGTSVTGMGRAGHTVALLAWRGESRVRINRTGPSVRRIP